MTKCPFLPTRTRCAMPDFEDASPPHFRPDGTASNQPVGVFAALQNAKEIFAGEWNDRAYEVVKKDKTRSYRITNPPSKWPARFGRPPGLHVRYDHITVDGQPAPGIVAVTVLWAFNNYDALKRAGAGVYFYIPKLQSAQEALIVERLLSGIEGIIGVPAGTLKIKMLYEEGSVLQSRGLLNAAGKITPRVIAKDMLNTPEKLFTPELWDSSYGVPQGDVTIERIQHAFYMAANYGYQILNGNFAAAIDDYELKLRFMNDLATYRIDVSWLWTLVRHQAVITKDGYLKRPALTEDGIEPAADAYAVKAGTRFTPELFRKLWEYHNEWTAEFFAEQDRRGDRGRFDRGKAGIIMDLLQRQLLSPRYIQHSARVLFIVGQTGAQERAQILDAIFLFSREEIEKRVKAGSLKPSVLSAFDYVYDIFPEATEDSRVRLQDTMAV